MPAATQKSFKTVWHATLRRAGIPYFRIYDLRSTYATRLSAGGVADEWVTQLLRQGDAKVFKKYSQMKLQMKREALAKLNRQATRAESSFGTAQANGSRVLAQFWHSWGKGIAKATEGQSNNSFGINRTYGGRGRTRTCDLLRVNKLDLLLYRLSAPNNFNNLGRLLSLSRQLLTGQYKPF